MAENVSAISDINGKTQVLISVPGSKSKGFFLDTTFWSNVQQSQRERNSLLKAELPISPLTAASVEHKAMQT